MLETGKYTSAESYRVRTIMAILGIQMSKRDIKKSFSMNESQFEELVEEANALSEMQCSNALYSFHGKEMEAETAFFELEDFIQPLYSYWQLRQPSYEEYAGIIRRMRKYIHRPLVEYAHFCLKIGALAEQEKKSSLAALIYRHTAMHSDEMDFKYRKRIMVRSVLRLSKLEFMRGISPDETLALQRKAIAMINQSNLTSDDALMMMYAGMGEHFGGTLEEGTVLRDKGIRYMKQFNYDNLEAEAVPLMCWHYYLKGDFKKTIAYYESFIIAIENRDQNSIITFAYPPIIFSYFFQGEYNQALVLAKNTYERAVRTGDELSASLLYAIIGRSYVYMKDMERGEQVLAEAYQRGVQLNYGWAKYYALLGQCLLEQRRGNYAACRELILQSRRVAEEDRFSPIIASPFVMEAQRGIKESGLEEIPDFEYDAELEKHLKSNNEHMKGVAYRHRAMSLKASGADSSAVIDAFLRSIMYLESAGNVDELRMSCGELALMYLERGDEVRTATYANKCWNYSSEEDRALLPKILLNYIESVDFLEEINLELETTWLELRNIVNEERLETRMLTSMGRLFGAESGAFVTIGSRQIEYRLTQNLDKSNRYSPQMQKAESVISQAAATGRCILQCRAGQSLRTQEEYGAEPSFCLAIPFRHEGQITAVLYLQSYFEGRFVPESALNAIEAFGERMSETVYLAMNYDKLTDGAAIVEISGEYGYNVKESRRYCTSTDDAVEEIFERIEKVAGTNIPVLITGETGVGKEVFAREVYERSDYRKTFIKVNCGAIPESLIESELFGYEKGSFTGAAQRKKGYFEMAEGGTIFLDEIGELSLLSQVKLLRVLQEHELMRVGGTEAVKVDFRLIAATNKDLAKEVEAGNFRKDLYYRLNVVQLEIPPLRSRKKDIPNLAKFFIEKFCSELGRSNCAIASETFVKMLEYSWPGNVRELENSLQRAVLFAEDGVIRMDFQMEEPEKLLLAEQPEKEESPVREPVAAASAESAAGDESVPAAAEEGDGFLTLEEMERRYIMQVIEHCGGKIGGRGGAAEILGMKRTTLISKMNKLGIGTRKTI